MSSVANNVFWKLAERTSAQLVSLVVSIVLARLLLPEDYGAVAMITVFIALANVLITEGLPSALIQKKDADDVDFSSVFFFNVGFSILLYLVLFAAAPAIAEFYGNEVLRPALRVLGVNVVVTSVLSLQQAYVSRNMIFRRLFKATLGGTLLSGALGIALALLGFGVWAIVFQQLSNAAVNCVVLWFTVRWRPVRAFSWARLKSLISFGWKILFEGTCQTIYVQLRSLLIGKVYTSADLGIYNRAMQFPSIVVDNVCVSISAVLFPAMSNLQDDLAAVKETLRKSTRVISYIMFPLLTGLGVAAEPVIYLVLGENWLPCVPYMQIFCVTYGAMVGMVTRHQALKAIGRSDVYMNEHIVYRVLALIILFSVFRVSVMAVALSDVAGSAIMVATVMFTSERYNGYAYREQVADIAPILGGCLVMGVAVFLVGLALDDLLVRLAVQVVVGIAVYAAFSALAKPEGFVYVKGYLSALRSRNAAAAAGDGTAGGNG